MNLIAIIIALITESSWKSINASRFYDWLLDYTGWLWARLGTEKWFNGIYGVLLAIAPGVVVIGLLQFALGSGPGLIFWGLMLAFSVIVLAASIGVRGMTHELEEYRRALERNDPEAAYLHVREFLRDSPPENAGEMNLRLLEVMLIRNNERLLAILFWFAVLGPVGAVIYRSICKLKGVRQSGKIIGDDFHHAIMRVHAILDWIPVRITALCYAIIGSFVESVQQWRAAVKEQPADRYASNQRVLIGSGLGALRLHDLEPGRDNDSLSEDITDAEALINRTVIVWLTLFALLTIAGWLS